MVILYFSLASGIYKFKIHSITVELLSKFKFLAFHPESGLKFKFPAFSLHMVILYFSLESGIYKYKIHFVTVELLAKFKFSAFHPESGLKFKSPAFFNSHGTITTTTHLMLRVAKRCFLINPKASGTFQEFPEYSW